MAEKAECANNILVVIEASWTDLCALSAEGSILFTFFLLTALVAGDTAVPTNLAV